MYTQHLNLELFTGEYWWGGAIHHGQQMPFGTGEFRFDLSQDLAGNQGAPLLISNKGRYVWSETPFQFEFREGHLSIEMNAEEVVVGEGHGDLRGAYRSASAQFFPPSGKHPSLKFFSVPQYNTWIEMGYEPTEEKILQYAQDILKHGFPPGILMIDDNWQEDYGTWSFHRGRFSNPKQLIAKLHDMGFLVMLWTCPFVSPDSYTFRDLRRRGYLVTDDTGKPVISDWWNGYSAILDCTNEAAVSWYKEQNSRLMEVFGVDGFKMDAGDPEYYAIEGRQHASSLKNAHCEAWARIGLDYEFNELRACWKLGGQALVQRLRDKRHNWEDLYTLIPNGLAQGLVGYAYNCPDMIGGGVDADFLDPGFTVDQELFVRYAQCSALFPMMQFSLAPWRVLDERHLSCCIQAAHLHSSMSDEIAQLVATAAIDGEPIMRHMAYVFPQNGYEKIHDQFMLGDRILVAPVLQHGQTTRKICFPPGQWKGDDGSEVVGPCVQEVFAPLERLPWYRSI